VVPGEVQIDGQHQEVQEDQGQRYQDVHIAALFVSAASTASRPILIERSEAEAAILRQHYNLLRMERL